LLSHFRFEISNLEWTGFVFNKSPASSPRLQTGGD
jgi:hypothetical protein